MKKKMLVLLIAVVVLTAGVVYAKDMQMQKKAGEYTVQLKLDKKSPVVGDNAAQIEVTDASGRLVTDAKVKLDYSMPAMPGMPAMNYTADITQTGEVYHAVLNLSMAGSWNIDVKVTHNKKTISAKFTIDAK
ncbi:FixH family protein [Candidatus Magnetominusculus xianensis]|uniref:Copper resistance determinant, crdA n=1 Tax=Candidatus Magnetominusculus xianensis TaxID=1748249 RepID=A0ABR5SH54_9BACT|nr:FixH family protein [Candidatus Magnetominusculus xianensis]KWT91030.1 putative copper resistance determinant, crdA [Candidatus Magnetominusculus xianensis]MBF0402577.1 FixH family protein [Nitrospirota bacterium]